MANKRTFVLNNPYPITSVGPVNADLDDYILNPMHEHGDMISGHTAGYPMRVPGNVTTDTLYLSQTGNGTVAGDPVWVANPFPGFGTNHTTVAYGDHTHTSVYAPIAAPVFTGSFGCSAWRFVCVGNQLLLQYNGVTMFTFDSDGTFHPSTTTSTTSTTTLAPTTSTTTSTSTLAPTTSTTTTTTIGSTTTSTTTTTTSSTTPALADPYVHGQNNNMPSKPANYTAIFPVVYDNVTSFKCDGSPNVQMELGTDYSFNVAAYAIFNDGGGNVSRTVTLTNANIILTVDGVPTTLQASGALDRDGQTFTSTLEPPSTWNPGDVGVVTFGAGTTIAASPLYTDC
jgi:hypothetical protein